MPLHKARARLELAATGRPASAEPARSGSYMRVVFEITAVRLLDATSQGGPGCPSQRAQSRNVEKLARSAIGLRDIEPQGALEPNGCANERRELTNRNILSPAYIDRALILVPVHQKEAGI